MSVTFWITGTRCDLDDPATYLNLCNSNAYDLLRWLGYEPAYGGELDARDLVARCRRRLWPEPRNFDPALDGSVEAAPGHVTVVVCGRRPGYLRDRTEALLRLAERAGDRTISFG